MNNYCCIHSTSFVLGMSKSKPILLLLRNNNAERDVNTWDRDSIGDW
jgi:hypothetical protein